MISKFKKLSKHTTQLMATDLVRTLNNTFDDKYLEEYFYTTGHRVLEIIPSTAKQFVDKKVNIQTRRCSKDIKKKYIIQYRSTLMQV